MVGSWSWGLTLLVHEFGRVAAPLAEAFCHGCGFFYSEMDGDEMKMAG